MADKKIYGAVAKFSSPEELLAAAHGMREKGFTKMDACTPFPIHGIDDALGIKRSPLGYFVFAGGVAGMLAAFALQYWTGAVNYPLVIGGKPLFAFEFSIPITFELTVLLAAFTAVGGMFFLNGLPRFYHPLFEYEGFKEFSDDKFILAIEARDPRFDTHEVPQMLNALGSEETEIVEETE